MGEARSFAFLRYGGGQLRASGPGKDEGLRSSRQGSRDAEDAKGPSFVRVNPSYVRASVSNIDRGRARCRSGQAALRYQFDVVTHIHT
jgi:hypothetical protein